VGRVVVVGSFNVDHVDGRGAAPARRQWRYHSGPGGGIQPGHGGGARRRRHRLRLRDRRRPGRAAGPDLASADRIDLRALASTEPTGTAGICVDAMPQQHRGRRRCERGVDAGVRRPAGATIAAAVVLCQLESRSRR
jgi:ribokinase